MPPGAVEAHTPREISVRRPQSQRVSGNATDPIVQTSTPISPAAQVLGQWEGLGAGYQSFSVTAAPPDPNIAVGPHHVVQWVNNAFVVFDKQGHQVQAPVSDSTFWGSSTCNQLGGYSDPIIQYDRSADRWLVGEVAIPLAAPLVGQFAQCFAVSTTSDPTGSYYMWAWGFGTSLNDYDKISVWPDGYYATWNIFANGGASFSGAEACAFDRNAMLIGAAKPALVCFHLGNSDALASLLPSDVDGSNAPPAGSPNFLVNINPSSSAVQLWKFHVDFVNTQNSTFTGPITLAGVAPFAAPCAQNCVAQPGTSQQLDTLSDRVMYRLAYRNFGDHESMVVNHTVFTPAGSAAVRWYEIRNPNGTPAIYQQGTFAPDSDSRWMGSIAMDRAGDIGVGYSVSSSVTYPSIRYSGWQVGDPLGTLEAETYAVIGGGSQTGTNRWGDYSAIRVDPADDCTFWYVQQYQATTASINWNTRIMSFQFPSCAQSLLPTSTTLGASPNPSTSGQSVTLTATVSPSAATGSVSFFDGASPLGSGNLSGGQATLSMSTLSVGTHSITAAYQGNGQYSGSTSAAVMQTVNAAVIGTSTSLTPSVNPSSYGQSVLFTATVSPASGSGTPAGTVTFLDGTTALGSSALNTSGIATLSTSNLSVGGHSITARYNGSTAYSGSTSPVVAQTVNTASTTTTVKSSRNPSGRGQTVTFTATVSPSRATGTVTFLDGTTVLGSKTLTNGTASLATSSLSVGSHSITAQYSGDGNDKGSTSAVLVQTVTATKR
jgi:hypothetical protein